MDGESRTDFVGGIFKTANKPHSSQTSLQHQHSIRHRKGFSTDHNQIIELEYHQDFHQKNLEGTEVQTSSHGCERYKDTQRWALRELASL